MAKLTGPLLSESAHGKIGQILTYSKRRTSPIVRDYRIPKKEATLDQWTQRHIIGLLTAQWQCSSDTNKNVWNEAAVKKGLNMSGFNLFLKTAMSDLFTHHGLCTYISMNEKTGILCNDNSGKTLIIWFFPYDPVTGPQRQPSLIKQYGNSLYFDGTTNGLAIEATPYVGIAGQMTIEVWCKPFDLPSNFNALIANVLTNNGFLLAITAARLAQLWIGDGNDWRGTEGTSIPILDGAWYHIAGTNDGVNSRLYVNGVQDGADKPCAAAADTTFGTTWIGNQGRNTRYYRGNIDEVRVYNRALGAAEIKKHYELLRLNKQRQPLLIH